VTEEEAVSLATVVATEPWEKTPADKEEEATEEKVTLETDEDDDERDDSNDETVDADGDRALRACR
jgi:hypothetical protein